MTPGTGWFTATKLLKALVTDRLMELNSEPRRLADGERTASVTLTVLRLPPSAAVLGVRPRTTGQ